MPEALWIILLACLCLLGAALILFRSSARGNPRDQSLRVNEMLLRHGDRLLAGNQPDGELPDGELPGAAGWIPSFLDRWLHRAGLPDTPRMYAMLLAPAVPIFLAAEIFLGFFYALLCLAVLYPLAVWFFLDWRIGHFKQRVIDQLPSFLESISRILSVGCSLELAFRNASEECEEPLRGISQQVVLRSRAGQSLEDAMTQVADIYAIRELGFVASVFHLGIRYGGNAHAILERLSVTMRERLRGQQELHAMTAETRMSAWILSALPVVVALVTLSTNPGYLVSMWTDPGGRTMLFAAFGLQVAGMFLLFRMAKIS